MKVRNGLVSNSSSSSFVISKDDINVAQIYAIHDHMKIGKKMGIYSSWREKDSYDEWKIDESFREIKGSTGMDNFDMDTFFRKIGVSEDKVKWDY